MVTSIFLPVSLFVLLRFFSLPLQLVIILGHNMSSPLLFGRECSHSQDLFFASAVKYSDMNTTEIMAKITTAIESTTCVFPDKEL